MRVITAPQPAATTTPVSSRREAVQLPVPWARPNTNTIASMAPAKAEPEISNVPIPASIAKSAPTAAPPDNPSTYGSASGLRSSTCIKAPATANRPPVAKAARVRGRRRSSSKVRCNALPSPWMTFQSSEGAMFTLPIAKANISAAREIAPSTSKERVILLSPVYTGVCRSYSRSRATSSLSQISRLASRSLGVGLEMGDAGTKNKLFFATAVIPV